MKQEFGGGWKEIFLQSAHAPHVQFEKKHAGFS